MSAVVNATLGSSTLRYKLYVASSLFDVLPVYQEADLSSSERFVGPGVLDFHGNYPKYDTFARFYVGQGTWYTGAPSIVFAGIGSAGTRSGIDGSDLGGQVGYVQKALVARTVSSDGTVVQQATSLKVRTVVLLKTNTFYDVEISAYASAYDSYPRLTGSAAVMVDPYFAIDPQFLAENPQAGEILLSPGVGNYPLPAVPEPASRTLLLGAGLFSFVALRRKNRRTSSLT